MNYKLFKEMQSELRKQYLENTGKRTIPADYNQGINDALAYVFEFYTPVPYRESGTFCTKGTDERTDNS